VIASAQERTGKERFSTPSSPASLFRYSELSPYPLSLFNLIIRRTAFDEDGDTGGREDWGEGKRDGDDIFPSLLNIADPRGENETVLFREFYTIACARRQR